MYDASLGTLPEFQGWSFFNTGGNPAPFVLGGLLVAKAPNGQEGWSEIDPNIDFGNDFVLEGVLHVISSAFDGRWTGYTFQVIDGSNRFLDIGIADAGYTWDQIAPLFPYLFADGRFHTIRLSVHSNMAKLLVDGANVDSIAITVGGQVPAGRVLFGPVFRASNTELKSICYGNSSTDCLTDLALSITPPLPTFTLNQTAVVNFRDSNFGARPSTSAKLFIPSTPAFRFVSATNASCGAVTGGLSCALGGVAAGGRLNFSLKVKAVQSGTFPITLTLTGQETDGNAANNVITRNVTVH